MEVRLEARRKTKQLNPDSMLCSGRLQAEIEQVPMQDLIIIMGDLNAKVGADNSGSDRVMGRHGSGIINENGERLVEFCTTNNLVIGGTLFPHR